MNKPSAHSSLDDQGIIPLIMILSILLAFLPLWYYSQREPSLAQANHFQDLNLRTTLTLLGDETILRELKVLNTRQSPSAPTIQTISQHTSKDTMTTQVDLFVRTSSHSFPNIPWSTLPSLSPLSLARISGAPESNPLRFSQFTCRFSTLKPNNNLNCAGNLVADDLILEPHTRAEFVVATGDCIFRTITLSRPTVIICGGNIEVNLWQSPQLTASSMIVSNQKIVIDSLAPTLPTASGATLTFYAREGVQIETKHQGEIFCFPPNGRANCPATNLAWPWIAGVGREM